jgi:DNA-binding MarR family transcriptional regulator
MKRKLVLEDYRALARFRHCIRNYIRFSEGIVHNAGLEPRQYQLLLALKGTPQHVRPRIVEVATQLRIQHHSAVGLVNRSEQMGLIRREHGTVDRREVLLRLTPAGEKMIANLVEIHLAEVFAQGADLLDALQAVLRRKAKRTSSMS